MAQAETRLGMDMEWRQHGAVSLEKREANLNISKFQTHIATCPPDNFKYMIPSMINSIILRLNSFTEFQAELLLFSVVSYLLTFY